MRFQTTTIAAIGIANPIHKRTQLDLAELMSQGFHLTDTQQKIVKKIYKSSGIEQRHSVLADYCKQPGEFEFFPNEPGSDFPTTAERMAIYKAHALTLALSAIENCFLHLDTVSKNDVTHLITVSCTGMYAPGIDIEIIQRLGLSSATNRTSINFMGCYGAFNGIKVADAICRADRKAVVLVVCVELCSIHVQKKFTLDSIISNALFADGAAAALIQGQPQQDKHLRVASFHCDLVPQTNQEMAWHITDSGFDMVLTSYVPEAIESGIAAFAKKLLKKSNLSLSDIDYYAIHPGGVKILQACEKSLAITAHDNRFSYDVLRQYGNMSSATVLFVLKKIWDQLQAQDHQKKIFSCAFGPGLTLESMLIEAHC